MELSHESLISHTWMLVTIADPAGLVSGCSGGRFTPHLPGDSAAENHGNAAMATVRPDSITFGMWANGLVGPGNDSPSLTSLQTRFVAQVLEGNVDWHIDGRKLTIVNGERGTLEYVQVDGGQ